MEKQSRWHFIGTISCLASLITGSILVTTWNISLFKLNLQWFNLQQKVPFSIPEILSDYKHLLRYVTFPWIKDLNFQYFPMSSSGEFHFEEVKQLFLLNNSLLIISILLAIGYMTYLSRSRQLWVLGITFKWLRWVPIMVVFLLFIDFESILTLVHEVFFNNDAWLFYPSTDPIILVLNDTFFLACFVHGFLIVQIGIIVLQLIGKRDLKIKKAGQ